MNDDYERLQLQTKKKYVLDTFRNGLRCIQDDSKVAQKFVFLCLALAVVALFFASGSSGNDVLSVVFRPIIYAVYAIAWLAECIGVIFVFGYLPHSWAYYDDFTRAGIYNQAREAPLLIKASRDGNIQQLTYYIKGYPLECWEDARKIFSRYPAVRDVLTVSFIFASSLSFSQSLLTLSLRDKGLWVVPRLAEKVRLDNCQGDCGIPQLIF